MQCTAYPPWFQNLFIIPSGRVLATCLLLNSDSDWVTIEIPVVEAEMENGSVMIDVFYISSTGTRNGTGINWWVNPNF